ncbi:hypothetical protein HS141_15905 [Cetobacterium somerae]|uniref:hypothetical protein n=1 Tax=Cetobacterium somerae TaxID=188913 RepID=UPI00211DB356|nr:hypothetical protein [Cetobacterium somerae]MCQ9628403.1 hypothetical protein [Cetobacterium somerae]
MKTIIDLKYDNLFDYFSSMGLNQQSDFIEKYSKSEEEEMLFHKIFERCLQIQQEKMLEEQEKDICIEYDVLLKDNIKLIISGKDIEELFDELKTRGFNPKMQGQYEFSVRVSQDVFNELQERF